jgi:hypothetical protein
MASFASLEQRMIHSYISTTPPLIPVAESLLPLSAQTDLWSFLRSVLLAAYDDPSLIGLSATPDQFFADFALNKSNPALHKSMVAARTKLEQLAMLLMDVSRSYVGDGDSLRGHREALPMQRKLIDSLARIGLDVGTDSDAVVITCPAYPKALKGLRYLTARVDASLGSWNRHACFRAFWNCRITDDLTAFARNLYVVQLDSATPLKSLIESLLTNGYWEHAEEIESVRYDIVKNSGDRTMRVYSPEAAKNYWGVSLYHDFRFQHPLALALRLPRYRDVLARFDSLPDMVRRTVVRRTKPCDGCGYCTQTDKTHTRSKLAVSVQDPTRGRRQLCPLYPVWGYQTTRLDEATLSEFLATLQAAEQLYESSGPGE